MATAAYWTDEILRDIVSALRISLGRVTADELGPTQAESWKQVQDWLISAQRVLAAPNAEARLERLPAFPLTGAQLRSLQTTVDQTARARLRLASSARTSRAIVTGPLLTSRTHVQTSLYRVNRSSFVLAAILVASLAIDIVDLFLFSGTSFQLVIGINLALICLAFAAWGLLHSRLRQHHWALHWHHSPATRAGH
jgi:hypothetical protein